MIGFALITLPATIVLVVYIFCVLFRLSFPKLFKSPREKADERLDRFMRRASIYYDLPDPSDDDVDY